MAVSWGGVAARRCLRSSRSVLVPAWKEEIAAPLLLSLGGVPKRGLEVSPTDPFRELVVRRARREDLGPRDLPLVRRLQDRLPASQADRHRHVRTHGHRLRILHPRIVRRKRCRRGRAADRQMSRRWLEGIVPGPGSWRMGQSRPPCEALPLSSEVHRVRVMDSRNDEPSP